MKTFYPTFTKKLLSKCLSFTETKIQIAEGEMKKQYTIRENRYFTEKTRGWRKSGIYLMLLWGAYDGTEKCNFIGTFLSEKISEISNKSETGLSRDNWRYIKCLRQKWYLTRENKKEIEKII